MFRLFVECKQVTNKWSLSVWRLIALLFGGGIENAAGVTTTAGRRPSMFCWRLPASMATANAIRRTSGRHLQFLEVLRLAAEKEDSRLLRDLNRT